jgi:geranylgeranyl pyrophosphate synthase
MRATCARSCLVRLQRPRFTALSSGCSNYRHASSSVFSDFIPESVKESVKSSLIEKITGDRRIEKVNGHHYPSTSEGNINQSSLGLHDPLDDLLLTEPCRYWPHLPAGVGAVDPFSLSKSDLDSLSESIREDLIGTDHPVLNKAAAYFFESSADGGKKVRPMMVMLLSRALAETVSDTATGQNSSLSPSTLLSHPNAWQRADLPHAQRRLAEISEMIHTASLFHDDVIDGADTRRGVPSVHMVFGNKTAILAGDYLLARASICLARLRHIQVIETMSTIIEHLVRGEVMQMRGSAPSERSSARLVYYLQKNFYKTGSLMANSCRSAALLGEYPEHLVEASYRYGKHVGMAFQLVDDVLDFEGSLSSLGKPALGDLKAGIATAPVLFAAEDQPGLEPLINRKFREDGDVETALDLIYRTDGIERTKELARIHAEKAMDAVLPFAPTMYRDALVQLAHKVVARTK